MLGYLCLLKSGPSMDKRFAVLQSVVLGRPYVILFFVLSGFVLSLSYMGKHRGWVHFVARRACRLLIPFLVLSVTFFTVRQAVPHTGGKEISSWLHDQWGSPISSVNLLDHLMMRAGERQYPLNHVVWSLVHEFRLSLLIPVFIAVGTRWGIWVLVVLSSVLWLGVQLYVASTLPGFPRGYSMFLFDAPDLLQSLLITLQFSFCFALGTAIAIRIGKLSAWRTGRAYIVVLSPLIALVALSQPHELGMAIGAGLLIYVVVASSIAGKLLLFAPFVWLGKVSFSLYLVHLPVISALSLSFGGHVHVYVSLFIAGLVSLALAEVAYQLVEAPSISLGRRIFQNQTSMGSGKEMPGEPKISIVYFSC